MNTIYIEKERRVINLDHVTDVKLFLTGGVSADKAYLQIVFMNGDELELEGEIGRRVFEILKNISPLQVREDK